MEQNDGVSQHILTLHNIFFLSSVLGPAGYIEVLFQKHESVVKIIFFRLHIEFI